MRWFTSDLHLGHKNIIGFCDRPYNSVDHMNSALIDNIITTIPVGDTLFILGDLAMGRLEETVPLIARVVDHGIRAVLVPGNHDAPHPAHRRCADPAALALYTDSGMNVVFPELIVSADYLVSHFPYDSDERHEDRFSEYRPLRRRGIETWLLHGHVHDSWLIRDHQINVGVDVWDYAPVSEDTLLAMMEGN